MNQNSKKLAIIISYVLILLQAIVGILYVPILLNGLGESEYGLYQLMGSMIAYFSIMDFGLSSSVIRYYSKYSALQDERGKENVLGISRRLYFGVTVLLVIAASIFYLNIENVFSNSLTVYEIEESKRIFVLLIFNIIITLMTNIHTSVITANEKFVFLRSISIIQVILQPILVIALITVQPYAFSVALIQTLLNLFLGIIKVFYSKKKLKMRCIFHFYDKAMVNGIIKLSLSVFVISIVDQIFWKSNQFILGIISGTAAVALYSIAAQIYMNYMPLSSTMQSIFLPQVSKMIALGASDRELSKIFIKLGRVQFMILSLVLTGFLIYGFEFIGLWTGSKYTDAYYIALMILFPFTLDLIQNIGFAIMQAKDIYEDRAKIYTFMSVLSIILAVILGSKFGAIGCAAGTGIAMFIGNGFIMNVYYAKKVKLDILGFWKSIGKIMPVLFILTALGFIGKQFLEIHSWSMLAMQICVYSLFYCTFIYLFAMNSYEKQMITSIWKRFKR